MADAYQHAIRNELDYWPGAKVEFSSRAKHDQAVLHYGGQSRFVVIPATPGDARRGALNALADVRKELTTLGATRTVRKPAARKRGRKVIGTQMPPRETMRHIERAPVKANPFDALAALLPVAETPPEHAPAPKLSWWRRILSFFKFEAEQSRSGSAPANPQSPSAAGATSNQGSTND